MAANYLIEVDERAAGILIPTGRAYAFHALEEPYAALEGVVFPDAFSAERAARRLASRMPAKGSGWR